MMVEPVLCYNRGCGKTFIPPDDDAAPRKEECLYHPGAPYFHDAYKEWTCCRKKSTDFTEFLNFPGCTRGAHTRVKPAEPEFVTGNLNKVDEEEEEKAKAEREQEQVRAPISAPKIPRPCRDSPRTRLSAQVARSLQDALRKSPLVAASPAVEGGETTVEKGEPCKNGGCKQTFTGEADVDSSECKFHPGVAIFHEGMKFWTCCTRRTSDWESFQRQEGCSQGVHKWLKDKEETVKCRYDWHQTATNVTVAIYCKRFDPEGSFVELNGVRLRSRIVFPEQGSHFDLDVELAGVIKPEESKATMFGTKVEIVLRKAEAGSWAKLGEEILSEEEKAAQLSSKVSEVVEEENQVDVLDLDDLELTGGGRQVLSLEASRGRSADLLNGGDNL